MMSSFGSFAEIVSVVTTGLAAVGAISVAWLGSAKSIRPEDDPLVFIVQRVANLACFGGIVHAWITINEENVRESITNTNWLTGSAVITAVLYSAMLMKWRVFRILPGKSNKTAKEYVFGGFLLTPAARKKFSEGKPIQSIFLSAGGEADRVWKPSSRVAARTTAAVLLALLTFLGTNSATRYAVAFKVIQSQKK